jgi:hypothetical protein
MRTLIIVIVFLVSVAWFCSCVNRAIVKADESSIIPHRNLTIEGKVTRQIVVGNLLIPKCSVEWRITGDTGGARMK